MHLGRHSICLALGLAQAACSSSEDKGTAPDGGPDGSSEATGGRTGSGGSVSSAGGGGGGAASSTGGKAAASGGAPASSGGAPATSGGTGGSDTGSDGGGADGYPDASTTGPDLTQCPGGALQKYSGSGDYRPETNEVVRCMEFDSRGIYIPSSVSNVTIEHCLFVTTVDLFVNVQGSGVTIRNSEFRGPAGTWIRNSYEGHHLTVQRNDFSGMANAVEFNVGNETIEGNFIHDFTTVEDDQHADGLQTDGTSNAVIRGNTVLLNDVAGATGAIAVFEGDDILVEGNKVAGGGYTVYPGGARSTNVRFLNNCFSTVFYPGKAQSGAFGPWYPSNNPPDLVRTGNTWCDGPREGQALNGNP